jgi:hypothetical protein
VLPESKNGFEIASQGIRNSREIMMQVPCLTVATRVDEYVYLNISTLVTTALFCWWWLWEAADRLA